MVGRRKKNAAESGNRKDDSATTMVIDAGARYGIHPTWQRFDAPLRYFGFEPDEDEVKRLRQQLQPVGFELVQMGLAKKEGEQNLYITKHRGCCSFLRVNPDSEWFRRYRPGEGDIERITRVKTCSVDGFAAARGIRVDFLKVDTEGTELEVLEGAEKQISNVLALRVSVNFQRAYNKQATFAEIHNYLLCKKFFLVNLDYFGRGVPYYGLFRNPDPLSLDAERYGVLIGTDGVWLKEYNSIRQRHRQSREAFAHAILKYAYFCILNHAADVGLDALTRFVTECPDGFNEKITTSHLYLGLRRTCAKLLGRWRVYPNAEWDLACTTFKRIFGLNLESGNKYWELIQSL